MTWRNMPSPCPEPAAMGRRRVHSFDLPPHMHRKVRGGTERFYYGRRQVALGSDFPAALKRYAEIHAGQARPGTLSDAIARYRRDSDGLASKAPKTQAEYTRQLATLDAWAGKLPLDGLTPAHVAEFMRERSVKRDDDGKAFGGPIVATREKALLSAVFNHARAAGLTNAPNPCAGIRGKKARRERYVEDAELLDAIAKAKQAGDPVLAGFLELAYLTGQRPGDVLRMTRAHIADGALRVRQDKTGAKVRLRIVGPLAELLASLQAGPVASLYLVHDERGQRFTLSAMRKRFRKLGADWQIRDLRAKYASDIGDAAMAQAGLGHTNRTTTDGYIRQRVGQLADPITRRIADKGNK